jgi:membrane associated rhomboid family serine protease
MFPSSKTIKQLFYANIAIFAIGMLLQFIGFPFYQLFALFPQEGFMPHQLITHQFLHGGLLHLAFNMLALISVGALVEDYFGRNRFILFYLLSGLGAAFLHMFMINSSIPMVGASGALYGVMVVFAILNPNELLYFFGIIGIRAKYLIGGLFLMEVILGFASQGDGVAHFGHVGGGVTGTLLYFCSKYLPKKKKKRWS